VKKVICAVMACLLLSAYGSLRPSLSGGEGVIIDWVDFIKINNKEYNAVYGGVIANLRFVCKKLAQFSLGWPSRLPNSEWRCSILGKGAGIYSVKSAPTRIAVKDKRAISRYTLYYAVDDTGCKWHFKHIPQEQIKKNRALLPDFYRERYGEEVFINRLNEKQDIIQFVSLLNEGPCFN